MGITSLHLHFTLRTFAGYKAEFPCIYQIPRTRDGLLTDGMNRKLARLVDITQIPYSIQLPVYA